MLMPSIFGENLFNDDWMDFSFPDVDKELYGKHAKNVMKLKDLTRKRRMKRMASTSVRSAIPVL